MSTQSEAAFLFNLPGKIRDYLRTDEYFRAFPILIEDDADVATEIDRALAGSIAGPTGLAGVTIVINEPVTGRTLPDTPAVFSTGGRLTFEIVEVPQINRSADNAGFGDSSLVVAECLAAVMKRFASGEAGWTNLHFYDDDAAIGPGIAAGDRSGIAVRENTVIRPVTVRFAGGIVDETAVVATPAVSSGGGTVTITCATADAAIYYTTDGGLPLWFAEGNTNNVGTLYSAPFSATAGAVITARAFKSGSRASVVAPHTVS